jgi:hypothetical protein
MLNALMEREALVQAFSPGSTLELGLKAFRGRASKCSLAAPSGNNCPRSLVLAGVTSRDSFSLGS